VISESNKQKYYKYGHWLCEGLEEFWAELVASRWLFVRTHYE